MPVVSNLITVLTTEDTSFTAGMRRAGQQTREFRAIQERELRAASAASDRFSRSLRGSLGNVAQQVQDVAVQFQSGTSAAIIFAQQGPQIAGAFGPVGAIIGAVAGVVTVAATAFFGFNKEADETKGILDTVVQGFDDAQAAADRYTKVLNQATEGQKRFAQQAAAIQAGGLRTQGEAAVQEITQGIISEFLAVPRAERPQSYAETRSNIRAVSDQIRQAILGGDPEKVRQLLDSSGLIRTPAGLELANRAVAIAEQLKVTEGVESGEALLISKLQEQQQGLAASFGGIDTAKGEAFKSDFEAAKRRQQEAIQLSEQAAKAAERDADARNKRIAALRLEIAQNDRLIAAGAQGVEAYEQMRRVIDAENKARSAGLDVSSREVAILAEQTRRLDEQVEARRRNARAMDEQTKAAENFYEKAGDRIDSMLDGQTANDNRDVENLQRNLQTSVASAIERGFEDGFGSVGDLVDQFGSLLKSTVASALADSLITEGLAKSISGALGTQLGTLAPSLAGTRAGSTTVGGAAAGAAGAAFGGYAIGQQFAGNRPLGTLAGAASGAGIGYVVGGPIGAGIGAGIGGIAGFFGSGQTGGTRNNNFDTTIDLATGTTSGGGLKPDQQNVNNVQAVIAELATLRLGLRGLGATLGDAALTIQSGNKSGLTLDGEKFANLADLNAAALRKALESASGLSANQNVALANTQATSAAGILGDLDFARQLDDLAAGGGALGQQLRENERQFEALRQKAEDLGLATSALDKAQGRDLAAIKQTVEAQLGLVSPLTAAIRNIRSAFGEAIANADELGLSEEKLIATRDRQIAAARKAVEDQRRLEAEQRQAERQRNLETRRADVLSSMEQAANIIRADFSRKLDEIGDRRQDIAGALNPLSNLRDDILIGDLGNRGVTQRLGTAQTLFDRAVRDARNAGTTAEEAQLLAQRGEALIGLGRDAYGSGAPANDLTRNVLSIVNELTGGLTREDRALRLSERGVIAAEKALEQNLPEEIRAAGELTAAQVAQANIRLDRLEAKLQALNDNLAALARKKA